MPNSQPIQSIQRAVKILFAVAGAEDGRAIPEIAHQVGLKPNTVSKLVRTLESEHLLTRRSAPLRFTLGYAIRELKHLEDARQLLTIGARELVCAQASFPVADLALLEGEDAECYHRYTVEARRPGVLVRHREFKQAPYNRASALLFLALAPAGIQALFYRSHPFVSEGRSVWGSQTRLNGFLEEVRRLGYSEPPFPDAVTGRFRVAAPVYSPEQRIVAAVAGSFSNASSLAQKKRLVRLCLNTGSTISHKLNSATESTL